jgi:probable O-glycosylation ligase (exosortase A-associated)
MTTIVLFSVFFGLIPAVLWQPYIGALLWVWLSLMSPQTLAGGAARTFPFALAIGVFTLTSWLASKKEAKRPPIDNPVVILLLAYIVWGTLTTVFALYQDGAWFLWARFIKIQLSNLLLLILLTTRPRIEALLWTICISLGYFIVRDGLHTLWSGGRYLAFGPGGTEIAGNNEFGVAMLMVAPLLFYLGRVAAWKWARLGAFGGLALALLTALGTYSRGALGGLGALGGMLLVVSRRRLALLAIGAVCAVAVVAFLPGFWLHRVESIGGFDTDTSFEGRVQAWTHGVHVALARPLVGGGMGAFSLPVYKKYSPGLHNRAAHSIYFQTLGEQGFVGLAIFLALIAAGWRNCLGAIRLARDKPELAWAGLLGRCLLFSMVGYMTAGALLTLANLDLYYMILSLTVALRRCVGEAAALERAVSAPAAALPSLTPAAE